MGRYAKLKGQKRGKTSSATRRYAPLTKRKKVVRDAGPVALHHDRESKRRRLEIAIEDIQGPSPACSSSPSPIPVNLPSILASPAGSSSSMRSTFSDFYGDTVGAYAAALRNAQMKHHWSDRSLETFLKLTGQFLDPDSRGLPASLYHLQQQEQGLSYCFGQIVYCCKHCGDFLDTDTSLCTSGGNCKGRFKPDTQLSCAMAHLDIQAQLERIVTGNIANVY